MSAKTISSLLRFTGSQKTAISYSTGSEWCDMSYRDFDDIVRESRSFLLKSGVKKRDRVLIVAENHAKWLPIFIAITTYGAIAVPVDGQASNTRLLNILNDSKPRLVIASKQFEEKVMVVFNDISFQSALVNFHFDLLQSKGDIIPEIAPPHPPQENDPAMIVYTSGTTGAPKGITHSHYSICSAIEHSLKVGNIMPEDVMLTILPYTHVFGLINAALVPFYLGGHNVIGNTLNPMELLTIISNYNVNYVCLVPRLAEIFAGLLGQMGRKFNGLKITIGGANCRPDIIAKLRSIGIRVGFGFGMTETCGGVFNSFDAPAGSVGKVIEPVAVKIDGPKNGVGELLIASPSNTIGVYGRPELNKTLWADHNYLKTGDLAQMDEQGFVYIRGRLKDVIIPAGGMNIYPDELEERLGSLSFLKELCVVGINDHGAEYPALVYRADADFFTKNDISNAREYVESKIGEMTSSWPEWERFHSLHEMNEPLPRSYSFKVQRNSLLEMLKCKNEFDSKSSSSAEAGACDAEVAKLFEGVKPLIAAHLNIPAEELSIYKPLSRFNRLDSLGKMSLLAYFQHNFQLEVGEFTESDFTTFSAFIKMLLRTNPKEKLMGVDLTDKMDEMPIPVPLDYSIEGIARRRKFLEERSGANLSVLANLDYSNSEALQGNVENLFGFCQMPLGIMGPLKINGEYASGEFYVPLATTEGALVASLARGAQLITVSGGAETKVFADSIPRTPIFMFGSLAHMAEFSEWVKANYSKLKEVAESTTGHGKLLSIDQYPLGANLCLRFTYNSGDASGQNMTTISTHKVMQYIKKEYSKNLIDCFLECNLSGDKKMNALNFTQNRGKKVIARVVIKGETIKTYLKTTAERMFKFYEMSVMGSAQAHTLGIQAHYSNSLTAVYMACGQDPACAAESACGITNFELIGGDLAVSVTLPGIMVGTVGGGTNLPTQKACLEILGCHGSGKAKKLAEIVAATVLAGEISLSASMSADDFAEAHAVYGRAKK